MADKTLVAMPLHQTPLPLQLAARVDQITFLPNQSKRCTASKVILDPPACQVGCYLDVFCASIGWHRVCLTHTVGLALERQNMLSWLVSRLRRGRWQCYRQQPEALPRRRRRWWWGFRQYHKFIHWRVIYTLICRNLISEPSSHTTISRADWCQLVNSCL